MGAEAFIAILRNGACVAKSLLPASHELVANPHGVKALGAVHAALDKLPPIDLLIAPLQLVAVVSGCLGGVMDLNKALARLDRARRWCQGASQMESHMYGRELGEMRGRLNAEYWDAAGSMLDAVLRFVFGACFYYFLLGTLKCCDDETMGWVLVAMEVALLICLYRGAVSIFRRRAKSLILLGTTADELLFDFDVLMERRLVDYADKRLLFTWENQVRYHPNALVADLEHLARNYERLAHVIQGVRNKRDPDAMRDAEEILHRVHQAGRSGLGQAWLEALIWLFDFVAFWGYAVFPLTFFYPDEKLYKAYLGDVYPGHSRVHYHGGLLGDIMWTVQPLAMLGSAAIRAYLEETLASGAPRFEIRRPLPAVAQKRTKSGSSPAVVPPPAKTSTVSSSSSSAEGSTVTRRTSAAAAGAGAAAAENATAAVAVAVAARSPVRKASPSSLASLTSPTTPGMADSKEKRSAVWSPSFLGRTTRASRKKAD